MIIIIGAFLIIFTPQLVQPFLADVDHHPSGHFDASYSDSFQAVSRALGPYLLVSYRVVWPVPFRVPCQAFTRVTIRINYKL